ncbi:MAG: 5-formyltetrahydrofolate cyclo-ligase, partial [Flavicella sp.]|nr:5-formyltetrahydrofolate cyclo-ligase [Flavicella sp.]
NTNCIKIGLSFFEPEESIEDVLPTDIALNFCITPKNIHSF